VTFDPVDLDLGGRVFRKKIVNRLAKDNGCALSCMTGQVRYCLGGGNIVGKEEKGGRGVSGG
jgi:hypothetical protein